jgi:hypothetical protein
LRERDRRKKSASPGNVIKSTSAAQVIIHALLAGPGPEMFDATGAFAESAPRAELFT